MTYLYHLLISVLVLPAISDSIISHFLCVFYHYSVSFELMAEIQCASLLENLLANFMKMHMHKLGISYVYIGSKPTNALVRL